MTRRRSKVAQTRSALYLAAKLLGDVRAVQTGTVGRRVRNRIAGRAGSGILWGKLFRN